VGSRMARGRWHNELGEDGVIVARGWGGVDVIVGSRTAPVGSTVLPTHG
jgi:hypothetical protein